jgi:hypothetical protein
MTDISLDSLFAKFVEDSSKEEEILVEAAQELNGKQVETLKKRIQGKKVKDAKATPSGTSAGKGKQKDEGAPATGGGVALRDFGKEQQVVDLFWDELEKMDPSSLISEEVTDAFKYVGFDPDVILREMLHRGRKAGKDKEGIKKDLVDIVTIAIVKGSVTENNLKKTSDAGKVLYKGLQTTYELVTGGARSKDSSYLTVARVAAAVPGLVTQILIRKPTFAKVFVGPFNSKSLPTYLRHQSAAACIPEGLPERLKDYVLGLITAFTADQTKALSKGKEGPEELFDKQANFVATTYGSKHPTEAKRQLIFSNFSLVNDFDKLNVVAQKIKKIKTDFSTLTAQEIEADLGKLA